MSPFRFSVGSGHWLPAGTALVLWAMAAGSLALWWLHWPPAMPPAAPVTSLTTSSVPAQSRVSLERALGHTGAVAAVPDEQTRYQLMGVIATASGKGSALIAVDGQPPKAYMLGHELDGGWILRTVTSSTAAFERHGGRLELVLSRSKKD